MSALLLTYPEHRIVRRGGVLDSTLADAGIIHPTSAELEACNFRSRGFLIPYYSYDGTPVLDKGKPFYRQRLSNPTDSRKYHQQAGSTLHIYFPKRLIDLVRRKKEQSRKCNLVIVEGEIKALSLVESGVVAIAIGGIWSFQKKHVLLPELSRFLDDLAPDEILFLGDSDTSHNTDFSKCAVRMSRLLSRPIRLPRIPVKCPKGIDDCRAEMGTAFDAFWRKIESEAPILQPDTDPDELAALLLRNQAALVPSLEEGERRKIFKRVVNDLAMMSSPHRSAYLEAVALCGFSRDVIQTAVQWVWKAVRSDSKKRQKVNIDQFFPCGIQKPTGSDQDGEYPPIVFADDLIDDPECVEPPMLIHGLIHEGTKAVLAGGSKVGKTWILLQLALCISTGIQFLGLRTTKSKVLYINLELKRFAMKARLIAIREAIGLKKSPNLAVWNLRHCAADIAVMLPNIISGARLHGFSLIIVDPVYKTLGGRDENSAGAMSEFTNLLESITSATGATVAYAHHFSKGSQYMKDPIDRLSGSGVFGRDADTIITLLEHQEPKCYIFEAVLRNLPEHRPFVVERKHPLIERRSDLSSAKPKMRNRGGLPSIESKIQEFVGTLAEEPISPSEIRKRIEKFFSVKERSAKQYLSVAVESGMLSKLASTGDYVKNKPQVQVGAE